MCFRFTLPAACCRRPLHFRCRDSEAVQQFRAAGLSPFGLFQGFGGPPGGTGKIDSSPPPLKLWCVTTRTTTHAVRATPPSNQRTNTNAICQPSFFFPLLRLLRNALLGRGFNGFLHTLEFFRASSPFSRISMHKPYVHTYTQTHLRRNTPNTIKIIRGP